MLVERPVRGREESGGAAGARVRVGIGAAGEDWVGVSVFVEQLK